MKKTYSKPMVIIESFVLNENMASVTSDCENTFSLQAQNVCGIPDSNGTGMTIFSTDVANGSCEVDGLPGIEYTYDGLCYHVPTETNNLFAS